MKLSSIANLFNQSVSSDCHCGNLVIDSRKVQPGDIFLAVVGENLDGHDFIVQALANGACAVIASKKLEIDAPCIVVEDTITALGKIAAHHRNILSCPVIAVTGSNGKTTVKEMIAAILPQPSYATHGNLNNHLGVPLSLLGLTPAHRYAVFELGANHIGEIAYTAAMVKPKVSVINNIAPAHVGEFGSIEAIAKAKGEIYAALADDGFAVINDDDDYAHFWDDEIKDKHVIRYSMKNDADVYAKKIEFDEHSCAQFELHTQDSHIDITLKQPGLHMIANALAAASACIAVGLSLDEIKRGLQDFGGVAGRLCYKRGMNDSIIIDDTYNANLNSAKAAIEVLRQTEGRKIMVLGDMGELGEYSEEHHRLVGKIAKNAGIEHFFSCGKESNHATLAYGQGAQHFVDQEKLIAELMPFITNKTSVLVKGSRAAQMEKIVTQLVQSTSEEK